MTEKSVSVMELEKKRTRIRRPVSHIVFDICNYCILLLVGLITVYPLWHIVCASFTDSRLLMSYNGILLWPREFTTAAYALMIKNPLIVKSYGNVIFIVITSCLLSILMTSLCAYVLSVKRVFWNKYLTIVIMVTMFFNGGIVPTYLLIAKWLHLNNSYAALILPAAINVYNMIIMRTSFESIPESLKESAKLDGAGHLRTLFLIVLPLSKAIIAVMLLYYAVAQWNSWFQASIYLTSRSKYPLQLILREILIENDTALMNNAEAGDQAAVGEAIKYAVIVFSTLPILCVYPFLQKYFTKGVMIGAVKG